MCVQRITLHRQPGYSSAQASIMVFVSQTIPDFEAFSWCDGFTKKHFDMFIKKKQKAWEEERRSIQDAAAMGGEGAGAGMGAGSDGLPANIANLDLGECYTPKAHEPVAFVDIAPTNAGSDTLRLPIPAKGRYIIIKLMPSSSNASHIFGNRTVNFRQMECEGLIGSHPLAPVLGTPDFHRYSALIKAEVWFQ